MRTWEQAVEKVQVERLSRKHEEPVKFRSLDDSKARYLRDFVRRTGEREEQRRLAAHNCSLDWLNWNALLHEYGKIMGGLSISPADTQYLNDVALRIHARGWGQFRIKLCYENCLLLRLHDDENRLGYCEGYADAGCGAIQHAWVTINGSVADPTLDAAERGSAPDPYRVYFGIEIPRRQILDLIKCECESPFVHHRRFWEAFGLRV